MKKAVLIAIAALAVLLGLTACRQKPPEPAVPLPVALSSFTHVKLDYDMDLGDYRYAFDLTQAQQDEFIRLLQADKWFDRGELPGRGYLPVVDAYGDQAWSLVVGYWDEEYTIIGLIDLSDEDRTRKIFYFAPFEVQENAKAFREKLKI